MSSARCRTSNVILPAGDARIGNTDYTVQLNSSPDTVSQFSRIPIKVVGSATVLLGDVAKVADSYAEQRGIVHVNGKRATYLAILKHSDASTLAVVEATRDTLPIIKASAPQGMDLKIDFDQSVFVRAAIMGVVREAVLSSILVSLMILAFLGSWRSVIVVCTSIPLAIFTAIIGLNLSGDTINIMTLGGLALAIGMLVDDATVEIENINRNFDMGKAITVAILDGASQIAVPAIVATLAICIVFFPVVLLSGAAKYLFTPMALAVVLAMLASYVLSRTLVPTLSRILFEGHREADEAKEENPGLLGRLNRKREHAFERLRTSYGNVLDLVLHHRVFTLVHVWADVRGHSGAALHHRHGFLPHRRCGIDEASRPRARRHASRRYRTVADAGRRPDSRDHPGRRNRHDQRHGGPAHFLQSGVRAHRQCRRHGRRGPDRAEACASSHRRLHGEDPPATAARVSRDRVSISNRPTS